MKKVLIGAISIAVQTAMIFAIGYYGFKKTIPTSIDESPTSNVAAIDTSKDAPYDVEQKNCMAEALYWEGRNQLAKGMLAIGSVIMNRVDRNEFPDTVCDVVHQGPRNGGKISRHKCQFSYYCDGESDTPNQDNIIERNAWDQAQKMAIQLLNGDYVDPTNGSTHYHATYVSPAWAKRMVLAGKIDDHLFYKKGNNG